PNASSLCALCASVVKSSERRQAPAVDGKIDPVDVRRGGGGEEGDGGGDLFGGGEAAGGDAGAGAFALLVGRRTAALGARFEEGLQAGGVGVAGQHIVDGDAEVGDFAGERLGP